MRWWRYGDAYIRMLACTSVSHLHHHQSLHYPLQHTSYTYPRSWYLQFYIYNIYSHPIHPYSIVEFELETYLFWILCVLHVVDARVFNMRASKRQCFSSFDDSVRFNLAKSRPLSITNSYLLIKPVRDGFRCIVLKIEYAFFFQFHRIGWMLNLITPAPTHTVHMPTKLLCEANWITRGGDAV